MASWEWIALGLVFLALLQLVALQYARKMSSEDEGSTPQAAAGTSIEASPERSRREPTGQEIVCEQCGTPNDPTFTYCRRCVSQLG